VKVKIAWYPWKLRIPQVCANCDVGNVPLKETPSSPPPILNPSTILMEDKLF